MPGSQESDLASLAANVADFDFREGRSCVAFRAAAPWVGSRAAQNAKRDLVADPQHSVSSGFTRSDKKAEFVLSQRAARR